MTTATTATTATAGTAGTAGTAAITDTAAPPGTPPGAARGDSGAAAGPTSAARGVMPLTDLLTQYAPAHSETWPRALQALLDDPVEAATIHTLAHDLLVNGRLREPVRLQESSVDDEDGYVYPRTIANGMHRICAHILTCTTDVYWRNDRTEDSETGVGSEVVTVRFRMRALTPDAAKILESEDDEVYFAPVHALRSFPLDAHTWAETDVMAVISGVHEVEYYNRWTDADRLVEQMRRRLHEWGIELEVVEVKPHHIGDDWDD